MYHIILHYLTNNEQRMPHCMPHASKNLCH